MKRSIALALAVATIGLAACGRESEPAANTETADTTTTMEGGGAYPSPTPSLAVEPLASDAAATATENAARNLAPRPSGVATPATGGRTPSPGPAATPETR